MQSQYDFDWHVRHRDRNAYSAKRIVGMLLQALPVGSVVDFGCGDGIWLNTFRDRGVGRIRGYDGPWNERDGLLIDPSCFRTADLSEPLPRDDDTAEFDLATCLEVAEHLPPASSTTLVQSICGHAPVALFGAAIPNQGGYRHINEQWQSFWSRLFEEQGYRRFDFIRPDIWDDPSIHFWYKQNIAVFVREARPDLIERASAAAGTTPAMPVDVVHPELFEAISNYDQIAFKPLSRRLLPNTLKKMRTMVSERFRA